MNTIATAPLDVKTTFRGVIEHLKLVRTRKGKQLVTATFTDSDGESAEVI